jgi:hypothetical protein
MGLGVGILLVGLGAILTWAVKNPENGAVNVHVVGVIVMLVGVAGFTLSLFFWESWAGWGWMQRRRYMGEAVPARRGWSFYGGRRRTAYVEEVPAGPPAAPPAPVAPPVAPAPPPDAPPW